MESKPVFEFICSHIQELSLMIAVISVFIAAITAVAAFMANHQNKKQYKESVQPQLSMSLVEFNSFLYLRVKNTGKSAARNIEIRVNGIRNNGSSDKLFLDDLFNGEFELYPEETVQGKSCNLRKKHSGDRISTSGDFCFVSSRWVKKENYI